MSTGGVRERRGIGLRAPITGLVLVLIVVLGGYYGWKATFGAEEGTTVIAGPTCRPTTTTPSTTPPAAPPPATSGVTTAPVTSAPLVLLPSDVTVNVFNATARQGLAVNTALLLQDRGFNTGVIDNDPLEAAVPETAQIRAGTADQPEVRLLIQHVPGAVVVPDGRTTNTVDLVIGDAFTTLGDAALVTPVPLATPRC